MCSPERIKWWFVIESKRVEDMRQGFTNDDAYIDRKKANRHNDKTFFDRLLLALLAVMLSEERENVPNHEAHIECKNRKPDVIRKIRRRKRFNREQSVSVELLIYVLLFHGHKHRPRTQNCVRKFVDVRCIATIFFLWNLFLIDICDHARQKLLHNVLCFQLPSPYVGSSHFLSLWRSRIWYYEETTKKSVHW